VSSPKRFAEMTGAELVTDRLSRVSASVSLEQVSVQQRDAILAERASEVIGMRDTIDALRTRAERAEQLVREIEVDAQEVRMALRTAEQERDALKDEVAGFEAMWEAREKAHDAALGEAKREGAREALGRLQEWWADTSLRTVTSFTVAQNIAAFRAREYPATPSGEGVTIDHDAPIEGAIDIHAHEPLVIPVEYEVRDCVFRESATTRITITAPLARRLLALAQTGEGV
jgi:hypothetical protein